jgi:enoyl-CoA hydratase/carnithine racemase
MGVISKPVIAAVEGFAMGGGFTLATCCDIVVTGRSARWNLPEVRLGWLTPWGIKSLVARVGYVNAKNLSYGLDILNGEEARSMGIADYVVDDGTVLAAAFERAEKIAALPRPAAAATKRFFSNYIMEKAEVMDFEANRLFSENCLHATAQQSLARKAGKAVA